VPCQKCIHLSSGKKYAVASDHRTCSQIGLNMLKMEGNAVDAAVATSFCIGVMNSFSSGIGGGGIMLVSEGGTPQIRVIDSREKAPYAAHENMFVDNVIEAQIGGKAIGVPGEVMGLYTAWQMYGKLPWRYLVEPSVALARVHRVNGLVEVVLKSKQNTILTHPQLDGFRAVYAPNGQLLKEGDFVRNEKLAQTLQIIADEGAHTFYNGTLAKMIVDDIQEVGGIITEQDLKDYSVRVTEPYCTEFFGHRVCTAQPEISGGVANIMALNMLERLYSRIPIFSKNTSHKKNKLLFHHYTIEAMKWVFSHRMHLGDPDFVDVEEIVNNMLSKCYAGKVAEHVLDDKTLDDFHEYAPLNNTIYADVPNQGTAHFSVVDEERRSVAFTSTVNLYFGSMVLGSRTGILFNDQMDDFSTPGEYNAFNIPPSKANFIAPGKRPLSSMSPTIIYKNGDFFMSVGASGGPIIITAVMQAILNVLVFQQSLDVAVGGPRFHHQLLPPQLLVDKEWDQESIRYFKNLGHDLQMIDFGKHQSLAVVQAILVGEDGGIDAVSDWRKPPGWSFSV